MKRILLHVCCGPCATHPVIELQREAFDVTLFFSNSNIHPEGEYIKRLNSLKEYAREVKIPLIIDAYDPAQWFEAIKGYETSPEGGARCRICFELRLRKTAQYAKSHGFDWFTTTLTISPHKNASVINQIGIQIGKEFSINFLPRNFKKKDGFKKSVILSKEYNLYRQDYCGCIFSAKAKK